jgi:hypothetical protein
MSAVDAVILGSIGLGCAVIFVTSAQMRFLVFVIGGLAVFGVVGGINLQKLAYLGAMGIAAGIALLSPQATATVGSGAERALLLSRPEYHPMEKALRASAGFFFAAAVFAAATGLANGASAVDVSRDGVTYVMLALAIPVGLNAGRTFTPRTIQWVIFVACAVSSVSFMVATSNARGVSQIRLSHLLLGSIALASLGVAVAFARAVAQRRDALAWLQPVVLIGPILVSGTRTGIALFAAVIGGFANGGARIGRVIRIAAILVFLAVVLVYTLSSFGSRFVDSSFLSSRVSSVTSILTSGVTSDKSGSDRQGQYEIASTYFRQSPILGQGFGMISEKGGPRDATSVSFYLDTPLLYLAKFGLVGTALLFAGVISLLRAPWRQTRLGPGLRDSRAVCLGLAAILLASLPLTAVTEDKGFMVAVGMLAALLVANLRSDEGAALAELRSN